MQQNYTKKTDQAPGSESFNRPPRIWTAPPQETVSIPTPPARQALPPMPATLTMLLPLVMISLLIIVSLIASHGSMQQLTFLLPMALFSIMTPLSTFLTAKQKVKATRRQWKESEKKYRKALAKIRAQLLEYATTQRHVALAFDPDPADLLERIEVRSQLWERRSDDPDFLAVRVGKGKRPFSTTVQAPDIDVAEPLAADVLKLKNEFISVKDIPCSVSLTKVKSLGITGRRQDVAALIRGILCQVAAHHSPEDVRLFGIYPTSQKHDWEWMAELPHTMPLKAGQQDRLVAAGEDEANSLLNVLLEELSQRASKNEGDGTAPPSTGIQAAPLPHLVVVVHDYVEVRKHPALTHVFKLGEQLGVSVIYMVAQQQSIPSECRGVVRLSDEGLVNYAAAGFAGETFDEVYADIMELDMAREIAHALLPLHVVQEGEDAVDLPTNVRFLDLVDLAYTDQYDAEKWWGNGSQPRFGRLRVPMGMGRDGPTWIDFNEAAHGPHGIIAGTTGAGKSELLQSIIVGLAITHHPHLVNFVLVDFKGGAAFKPFENIPHTVGMVSDLSGRLTERALTALKSELRRREYVLGSSNAKKIAEYQAMREQNPSMEPLPNLFIIIDEFAELAKEHPTFMEGLVSVVQKGRSLGVHLILATQKPTGSVNPNIWSNLKFRICLRVASLQDSRDMLGRSEAALLPSTIPGRGYFQIGSEVFDLFQSARTSLPARVANESTIALRQASVGAGEVTDLKVLMSAIEPFTATLGKQLFKPWPEPLPHRVSLTEIYRHLGPIPWKKNSPPYGWLTCPIGLIDLPADQKQEPLLLDMPRQGGNVMIAGASGTGKSTFLRTLITSLIQTHSPSQLHLYMVDFGGQALRIFEKLPHVGGVFGEADEEYILRLLRKLNGIIEERKQLCMANQIDDFLSYQRRRAENPQLLEMPAVVLVIDKFIEFKQAHDKEMDTLLNIARNGRTYGVYIVLTVDRPVAVSSQLLSLFEIRIGLRLVELTDSLILLGKQDAAQLDPTLLGRGYKRNKILEEIQIALPVPGEDDDEQMRQLDEMVSAVAKAGKEMRLSQAPPIRLLPEYVRADYFLMEVVSNTLQGQNGKQPGELLPPPSLRIRLGIEDFSLNPIVLELNADTPHVLVGGGPGSGRTSVLHTCLMMLASTPENKHARVILLDFRRNSRILRRLSNVWMYADNEERLIETINTLKVELRDRAVRLRDELERQQDDDESVGTREVPIVLMIDDYEQFSVLTRNPLNDLKEFILQARDLGLHIIVAGSPGDLSKNEVLLQQIRACRMGVILGADPQDQALLGVRMSDLPPGRGYVVRRNKRYLVQVAHLDPKTMMPWLTRFRRAPSVPVSLPQVQVSEPASEDQLLLVEAKRITDAINPAPT